MKYSLFNSEVEGFTREKFSAIKIGILGASVFVGAVFVGWLLNVAPKIVTFMDVFTDTLTRI